MLWGTTLGENCNSLVSLSVHFLITCSNSLPKDVRVLYYIHEVEQGSSVFFFILTWQRFSDLHPQYFYTDQPGFHFFFKLPDTLRFSSILFGNFPNVKKNFFFFTSHNNLVYFFSGQRNIHSTQIVWCSQNSTNFVHGFSPFFWLLLVFQHYTNFFLFDENRPEPRG